MGWATLINLFEMEGLIELHYIPSIAYFVVLHRCDTVVIERHENFVKQTYRNRCVINTSQGLSRLVVPLTSRHGKVLITDIKIDHSQKWLNNHWRAIRSAYARAPFFEHYADALHDTLFRQHVFLYDLNMELLTICLKWLKLSVTIVESSRYIPEVSEEFFDLRHVIHPKNPLPGKVGFKEVQYAQVFGSKFVPNLSIIDLVFCEGPSARHVVESSAGT